MTKKEEIEAFVCLTRPSSKFFSITHSTEFTETHNQDVKQYFYVSLYDEHIENNLLKYKDGTQVLVENTYMGSFVYNIGLCFFYCYSNFEGKVRDQQLELLLSYNFKKFFGEQLYNRKNCIFSRAILLETLFYEQQTMKVIFEDFILKEENVELTQIIKQSSTGIFSFHELGHVYFNDDNLVWDSFINEPEINDLFNSSYLFVKENYTPEFLLEYKCDILAFYQIFNEYKSKIELPTLLNLLVLNFMTMSVFYSLNLSAEKTVDWLNIHCSNEKVNFENIGLQQGEYEYTIQADEEMAIRARLMILACENVAKHHGIKTSETNPSIFPDPNSSETILNSIFQTFMNDKKPNQRAMARLVAEALHSHEKGMEYLYLRSKVFTSNREKLIL